MTMNGTAAKDKRKRSDLKAIPAGLAEAKIIFVTNQKGGSGKTVTAMNIAAGLASSGYRVLVVDIDPQNTIVQWFENNDANSIPFQFANLAASTDTAHREIEKKMGDYDFIVIDGRPQVDKRVTQMLMISDLVVIPLRPNTMDLNATEVLVKQIQSVKEVDNPSLSYALLLNQVVDERRMLARACVEAIQAHDLPVFETRIKMRECYPQAFALGETAYSDSSVFRPAADEVSKLTEEVLALVGVSR